jgi:hypothetical protein
LVLFKPDAMDGPEVADKLVMTSAKIAAISMRRLLEFVPRAAFSGLHRSAAKAGLQQSYRVEILDPLAIADTSLFRPGTLWRHKGSMLQMASEHTLHMQESFSQMSLQIHHVLSDFTGTCGQAILDAILAGQRDPLG